MLSRTHINLLLVVLSVSIVMALLFALGLPFLGAATIVDPLQLPWWSLIAPMLGGAATISFVYRGCKKAREANSGEAIADLPAQSFFLFNVTVILGVITGLLLEEPHPLFTTHPLLVYIGIPALTLIMALLLRYLIQFPLVKEMKRLHPLSIAQEPHRRGSPRRPLLQGNLPLEKPRGSRGIAPRAPGFTLPGLGVLEIQPTITLTALSISAIALALIGVYTYYRIQITQQELNKHHLEDLLQVTTAQALQLPPQGLVPFFKAYPISLHGTPVLLDKAGRTLTPGAGLPAGASISLKDWRCYSGHQSYQCTRGMVGRDHQLVILQASTFLDQEVASREMIWIFLPLAAMFLLFSGFLGHAIGNDISKDFQTMARQLSTMSQQNHLELDRPVTVTSIDEVGDLTAALGQLRGTLESELKEYRESLLKAREADHLKNMFFSDVSHELRTPLTSICGYSQLLLEEDLPPSQKDDVRIINNSGKFLLNLINEVIDISVIESGHMKLNFEKVDLAVLCTEIVDEQRPVALKKQNVTGKTLALEIEIDAPIPAILGDPLRLRQIIQNLLSNAIKFTVEGSVKLRLLKRGLDNVVFVVTDTGPGIGANDLSHIFERYRQTGKLKSQQQGSGLGLGICKQLVTLHGGEIFAESEIERGSTFTVVLPIALQNTQRSLESLS